MEEYNSSMCRICFQDYKDDFESVFVKDTNKNELSQLGLLYEELFNLSIQANEHHPQYLCNYCILQLKLFHKFKTKAVEAQVKFSEFCDEGKEDFSILELSDDETDMKFESELNDDNDNQLSLIPEDTNNISALEIDENVIQDGKEDEEFEEVQYLEDAEDESESLSEMEQDLDMIPDKIWPESEPENFPCKDCDKVFEKRGQLTRHRSEMHKLIKHQCNLCPARFILAELLEVHMKTHKGLPAYQCEICNKTFKQKGGYQYHLRGHRNERDFLCHLCSKRFLNIWDLRTHLRFHSDERPFQCDVCGKGFQTHSSMKNHRYMHFENQHECKYCLQKFCTPPTLKVHIKTVHLNQYSYECKSCSKKFKRLHHFKQHQKTHIRKMEAIKQ